MASVLFMHIFKGTKANPNTAIQM